MNIATVDLDDTLIETHKHYKESISKYLDYMNKNFGFSKEEVRKAYESNDRKLVKKMGLSEDRFPTAFKQTTEKLLQNHKYINLKQQKIKSEKIAREVYKNEREYREEGFIEGAEDMLNRLDEEFDQLHLLTAGVPKIQNPKIQGLNLERWFDEIHIVEINGKKDKLKQLKKKYNPTHIVHIGNSEQSDVEAAIRANVDAVYLQTSQWMGRTGTDYNKINNVSIYPSVVEYTNSLAKNKV